jgi:hypothetical protein
MREEGEEGHPKREIVSEAKPIALVLVVCFPTIYALFFELASRTFVSPKGLLPRGNHMVFTWNMLGAEQVCPPAHPEGGQHPCQEQTPHE